MVRGSHYRRQVIARPRKSLLGFVVGALVLVALLALLWFLRPALQQGLSSDGLLAETGAASRQDVPDDGVVVEDAEPAAASESQTIIRWTDAGGGDVLVINAEDGDASLVVGEGVAGEQVFEEIILDEGLGAAADGGELEAPVPPSGWVFESVDGGMAANLRVVVPEGSRDAYVKLRDARSGEMILSFYVRSGTTVKACVPARLCEFAYSLGERDQWLGPVEDFGASALYAKSDVELDFRKPGNLYTYTFDTEDGNVNPIPITRGEFSRDGGGDFEGEPLVMA